MKSSTAAIIAILTSISLQAHAEGWPLSSVAVTVEVPLAGLEGHLDRQLPNPLHARRRPGQICVEKEELCTKIPEFRGFKIYSRMECVDISPRIRCDVFESVSREGPLTLEGDGGTLEVVQGARASVTAQGTGELGRNIRQTVRAAAEFTLTVSPSISADWTPRADVDLRYRWIDAPEFRLFGLIPITIRGEVEPEFDAAIDRLERERVPELLSGLGLRDRMATLWANVQEPRDISPGEGLPPLHVHFRPETVAISGIDFSDGIARAAIRIDGRTAVTDTPIGPWGAPTPLPDLDALPTEPRGFELEVPVRLGPGTLTEAMGSTLPRTFRIERPVAGNVTVRSGRFEPVERGLRVALDVTATPDAALVPGYEGVVTIDMRPVYDPASKAVRLEALAFAPETPAAVRRLFALAVALGAIDDFIVVPLAGELDAMHVALEAALFAADAPGIGRSGGIDVDVVRIGADADGLSVDLRAVGTLDLRIGLAR